MTRRLFFSSESRSSESGDGRAERADGSSEMGVPIAIGRSKKYANITNSPLQYSTAFQLQGAAIHKFTDSPILLPDSYRDSYSPSR